MEDKKLPPHKFDMLSEMSYREVFNFAFRYVGFIMQALAKELGEPEFMNALRKVVVKRAQDQGREASVKAGNNDFKTYVDMAKQLDELMDHAIRLKAVEDSARAYEVQVQECLWAQTFSQLGIPEIGYALICHGDFGECEGFNPRIELKRTKTLMQGNDCCNHRWIFKEQ